MPELADIASSQGFSKVIFKIATRLLVPFEYIIIIGKRNAFLLCRKGV